jgi:hypothetical protein
LRLWLHAHRRPRSVLDRSDKKVFKDCIPHANLLSGRAHHPFCSCTYMYVHSLKRAYTPSHQFSLMLVRQV